LPRLERPRRSLLARGHEQLVVVQLDEGVKHREDSATERGVPPLGERCSSVREWALAAPRSPLDRLEALRRQRRGGVSFRAVGTRPGPRGIVDHGARSERGVPPVESEQGRPVIELSFSEVVYFKKERILFFQNPPYWSKYEEHVLDGRGVDRVGGRGLRDD